MRCKNLFFLAFLVTLLALAPFVSSSCTVTLDKSVYVAGETATAEMSCSTNPEKNTAYTLNWTYQNGTSVEVDSGTTPNVAGQNFYQSYMIPSGWPEGIFLNASLSGDGLSVTQNDSANVTVFGGGGSATLEIVNTTFGGGYLGLVSSVKATVTDENGKKISGGSCEVSALSNDETQVLLSVTTYPINGMVEVSDILPPTRFREGTDYAYEINCFCGSTGSFNECIDEDGTAITNSVGSARNFFTIKTYLTLNTLTDGTIYEMKDFVTVCVNITNIDYPERIPLEIDYQARCSVGSDNNDDLDRVLVFSDGQSYDKRGISSGTTQMQCKKFIIPEIRSYEGNNNTCYASSNVWVIGEDGNKVLGYPTTSNVFYINSTELNLNVDWTQLSNLTFNSIINLSADSFKDWNGSNFGNIDIRLISSDETIDANINDLLIGSDLDNFVSSRYIKSISVTNLAGSSITPYLEYNEDGNLEIELRDQWLNQSGWYNLTLVFNDFEERQAIALEGIENKTGTFHLDVDCPSQGLIGSDMNCSITAQIEDPELVQKEVDFTCFIYDGSSEFSSLNFNQMINRTSLTLYRNFSVPASFTNGQSYILQCYADYYNFGSRRDSFYDTFTAVTSLTSSDSTSSSSDSSAYGGGFLTGDAVVGLPDEDEDRGISFFGPDGPLGIDSGAFSKLMNVLLVLALLIFIFVVVSAKRKKTSLKTKRALKSFVIALAVVAVLGLLFYGSMIFDSSSAVGSGELIKGMILTVFITIILLVVLKVLNIRGEIRFGEPDSFTRIRKQMEYQDKLNRQLLKKSGLKDYKK